MLERRKSVREHGARHRLRRLLWLIVLGLVVAGVAWLLQSPALSVKVITLSGVDRSSADALLGEAGIVQGRPTVAVRPGKAEDVLRSDPWVAEADVTVTWPGTVDVEVRERKPGLWLRLDDGWALAATDGVVVELADLPTETLAMADLVIAPVLPGEVMIDDWALGVLEFLLGLDAELRNETVIVGAPEGLWATIPGHRVRLGRATEMPAKAAALHALLATDLEDGLTIDLLSPTRPAVTLPVGSAGAESDGSSASDEGAETDNAQLEVEG